MRALAGRFFRTLPGLVAIRGSLVVRAGAQDTVFDLRDETMRIKGGPGPLITPLGRSWRR